MPAFPFQLNLPDKVELANTLSLLHVDSIRLVLSMLDCDFMANSSSVGGTSSSTVILLPSAIFVASGLLGVGGDSSTG